MGMLLIDVVVVSIFKTYVALCCLMLDQLLYVAFIKILTQLNHVCADKT